MVDEISKALEEAEQQGGVDMGEGSGEQSNEPQESSQVSSVEAANDANQSTESSTVEHQETPSEKDAKTESDENVPFHEHPRFKKLTSRNRELEDRYNQLDDRYNQLLGRMDQMTHQSKTQESEVTPEQEQGIRQLAGLMKSRPEFKEALGLDELEVLKRQNKELRQSQIDKAFDEEEKVLKGNIEKFGLAKSKDEMDEILDELESHIDSDPFFKKYKGTPGVWTKAFNDLYMGNGRALELGKRLAAKQEIRRQEELKKQQTESKGKPVNQTNRKLTGNALKDTLQLIESAGGEDAVDMSS